MRDAHTHSNYNTETFGEEKKIIFIKLLANLKFIFKKIQTDFGGSEVLIRYFL